MASDVRRNIRRIVGMLWVMVTLTLHGTMARIVDLSHTISMATPMSPGNPNYNRTSLMAGDLKPGLYVHFNKYSIGEHGGTHIDAPAHFKRGGKSLEQIAIEDTVLEAAMIDCGNEADRNPMFTVTVQTLTDWESVHGQIPHGGAVVFNFNWSSRFGDLNAFYNTKNLSDENSYQFPHISIEAGEWMIQRRNVKAIGIDTASPDLYSSNYPVHTAFLTDDRIIVENVKDPGLLPAKNFVFHFSPVKFVGGSGIQVRAYGVTYDPGNHALRVTSSLSLFSVCCVLSRMFIN